MTNAVPAAHTLFSFAGRRALVTGAAGGIGKAIGLRFAQMGADVVLVDVDEEKLAATRGEIAGAAATVDVTSYALDLSDRAGIDDLWERFTDDTLPDIIVNNAGIYPMRDFLEVDDDMLEHTLAVNLKAATWMCQQFIRRRKGKGGTIVNVSSIEAILPFKDGMIPYTMSKAGVLALTRGLARDYGSAGFRINAIVPGAIRTPGTEHLIKEALTKLRFRMWGTGYDFQRRLPLKRWGSPDEVARVVLFLASELAGYVQGAAIPVDGGFLST